MQHSKTQIRSKNTKKSFAEIFKNIHRTDHKKKWGHQPANQILDSKLTQDLQKSFLDLSEIRSFETVKESHRTSSASIFGLIPSQSHSNYPPQPPKFNSLQAHLQALQIKTAASGGSSNQAASGNVQAHRATRLSKQSVPGRGAGGLATTPKWPSPAGIC